jgi:cytochrome c oxidase subunit IV
MNTSTVREESLKNDIIVYVVILVIAGLQVLLAYRGGTIGQHVITMLSLAIIQAGLGIMFFMHLFQEKRSLMFALIPAMVFVLLMMNVIWSDSFRIIHLKPWPN